MRAVVLGSGRVGSGVARELDGRGWQVTVVDHDRDALARLGEGFGGRKQHGDVRRADVLAAAGIAVADAAAVVTGVDAVNAAVALAVRRRHHVPTVVARLADPRVAEVAQRLGIRTLAPVTWGIRRIAELVVAAELGEPHGIGTGGVELVEVRVPPLLDGRPVGELEVAGELVVVAVTTHGRTRLVSPAERLVAGDLVHVAVAGTSRGRLETLVGHPAVGR